MGSLDSGRRRLLLFWVLFALTTQTASAKLHSPSTLLANAGAAADNSTAAPTVTPAEQKTPAPTPTPGGTPAPTVTPANNNATAAPTPTPGGTPAPTVSPGDHGTPAPTSSPTKKATLPPTPVPNVTLAPTSPPTAAPSEAPTASPVGPAPHKMSFLRIIGKTIAWLIIIALSVLAFGAIMSNRYRIYFFLRGVWYTILRMDCTLWILRKLRLSDYQPVDNSLNTIIFDNEMQEGLLMQENDG